MAPIGGPPVLAVGHQREKIGFDRTKVELFEGFGIREIRTQRVRLGRMLVQDFQIQLVRPPVAV
jgi:hypothetical protein